MKIYFLYMPAVILSTHDFGTMRAASVEMWFKKPGIISAFLWNIPFKEREAFVSCLKDIIDPSGLVVIGYADEPYDKDPYINVPALMNTAFYDVRRTVFEGSLNRYVLICSRPKL